jgi:ADP-ribose pyrophosphatase
VRPASSSSAFAGRFLRVDVERWTDPDREREIVRHPSAAAIVALTAEQQVVLVRQLREAVRRPLLEIPAGIYDVEGEPPDRTARRELEEETGYRASALEPLGSIYTSPGFSDERIDLFLATGRPVGKPEEGIKVVEMNLDEAVREIEAGSIADAKSVAGLLLAARRLA